MWTVPGIGYPSDYDALRSSGIDISGKIALVKRGTSSFEEKASAAYAAGAAGIIIYNNTTGMIRMSIGKDLDIAACSINKEVGDILASRQTGTMEVNRANLAGPFMSDFSSWGPLPSLTLEPDITAHGGDILSAVTGYDQYAIQSGTSMATPNLAERRSACETVFAGKISRHHGVAAVVDDSAAHHEHGYNRLQRRGQVLIRPASRARDLPTLTARSRRRDT